MGWLSNRRDVATVICQWALDEGRLCPNWTNEGAVYCTTHAQKIAAIDALADEVVKVINRAREKKTEEE